MSAEVKGNQENIQDQDPEEEVDPTNKENS